MRIIDGMVVVIDTETTGRDPTRDRVVAFGVARFDSGIFDAGDSILVNPGEAAIAHSIASGASDVHRIDTDTLRAAPTFADAAQQIIDLIHYADRHFAICAYNADYDVTILGAEFARAGFPNPFATLSPPIDPRWFAWAQDPVRSSRLSAACETFGVAHHGEHDAAHDARATGELLFVLNRMGIVPSHTDDIRRLQTTYAQRHRNSRALFGSQAVFDDAGAVRVLRGPRPGTLITEIDEYCLNQIIADDQAPAPLVDIVRAELARRTQPR